MAPTDDLFRFGTSRQNAFGRQKSLDLVGYDREALLQKFKASCACIGHWTSVVTRQVILAEIGREKDTLFDCDDFLTFHTTDDYETSK